MNKQVYWIPGPPWMDQLAILARPRGGDWLAGDIAAWKEAGIDVVVSLLEQQEISELGLDKESSSCEEEGIDFRSFPIADRGVPASRQKALQFLNSLLGELDMEKKVGIHCRIGLGRSALVAASLLALVGMDANEAFRRIERVRGCSVPDTQEQRMWVNIVPVYARSMESEPSSFVGGIKET